MTSGKHRPPRLVYLTAGAGGMYCGSCLHDNALVKALREMRWDAQLVPLYTPIRTDEEDVSIDRVFFGGVNVFLQDKIPLFRWIPRWLDRWLDQPAILRRVTSKAVETDASVLGDLTISMLRGMDGRQRKEVKRLVDWMATKSKPDIVVVTNLLVSGFFPEFKRRLGVPLVVTLQGDDVFLDRLPEHERRLCIELIRKNAQSADGFIVHSQAFAARMVDYFELPEDRFHVTPLGIDTHDYESRQPGEKAIGESVQLGYLARLAPEKGLDKLVDAFIRLRRECEFENVRLRIAGWLSPPDRDYADQQWDKLRQAGLENEYEYLGVLDRKQKLDFLAGLDLFSVPTAQAEPKGLFVLEAMASGIPVVQPAHGAFPEMIEPSGGGVLYPPDHPERYLTELETLIRSPDLRRRLGRSGRQFVLTHRNHASMATATTAILRHFL